MFKTLIYGGIEYPKFEIDEYGNVRNAETKRIYKNSISKTGYWHITLPMGHRGKVKAIKIHKGVAETFIPNPDNLPVVNHIDENKLNCHISNLEWTTYKGNSVAYCKNASKKETYFNNRRLTYEQAQDIRVKSKKCSIRELSRQYNISRKSITDIIKGITYSNGF